MILHLSSEFTDAKRPISILWKKIDFLKFGELYSTKERYPFRNLKNSATKQRHPNVWKQIPQILSEIHSSKNFGRNSCNQSGRIRIIHRKQTEIMVRNFCKEHLNGDHSPSSITHKSFVFQLIFYMWSSA